MIKEGTTGTNFLKVYPSFLMCILILGAVVLHALFIWIVLFFLIGFLLGVLGVQDNWCFFSAAAEMNIQKCYNQAELKITKMYNIWLSKFQKRIVRAVILLTMAILRPSCFGNITAIFAKDYQCVLMVVIAQSIPKQIFYHVICASSEN